MKSTDVIRTCPMCDEGQLELRTHAITIHCNDKPLVVKGMEYCECPLCGADPVLEDQITRNERRAAVDIPSTIQSQLTSRKKP